MKKAICVICVNLRHRGRAQLFYLRQMLKHSCFLTQIDSRGYCVTRAWRAVTRITPVANDWICDRQKAMLFARGLAATAKRIGGAREAAEAARTNSSNQEDSRSWKSH